MTCVRKCAMNAKRCLLVSIVGCSAALASQAGEPAEWNQWRGPNRDGKSLDKGLLKSWPEGGPKLLWQVEGVGSGFSSATTGGGLIYITGRKEPGNPIKPPPAKHIYHRPGDRLYIFAIDMDGKYKWARDVAKAWMSYYKGSRASVTYDNGKLYLLTGTGEIGCYDAKNGDAVWKRDFKDFSAMVITNRHRFGHSESVLVFDDKAIVSPGGDCFMVALDKNTGNTLYCFDVKAK